jgi:hypothetical protein
VSLNAIPPGPDLSGRDQVKFSPRLHRPWGLENTRPPPITVATAAILGIEIFASSFISDNNIAILVEYQEKGASRITFCDG